MQVNLHQDGMVSEIARTCSLKRMRFRSPGSTAAAATFAKYKTE